MGRQIANISAVYHLFDPIVTLSTEYPAISFSLTSYPHFRITLSGAIHSLASLYPDKNLASEARYENVPGNHPYLFAAGLGG